MIRVVFHLPLRALQGFLTSIVLLMDIVLPIPSYTQICRRAKYLGQELSKSSIASLNCVSVASSDNVHVHSRSLIQGNLIKKRFD